MSDNLELTRNPRVLTDIMSSYSSKSQFYLHTASIASQNISCEYVSCRQNEDSYLLDYWWLFER